MGKDLLGNDLGKGFTQRKDLLYLARRKTKDYEVALSSLDIEVLRVDFALAVQEAERQAFIGKKLVVKTVNEWFYTWFEIFKGPSIRTKFQYQRRYVNTYGKYIGEDDILTVNAIYLQSITNKLLYEEKRSERGVRDALGSVKECFEAAVSVQIIPVNPAAPVKVGLETKSTSASFIASMNIKFLKRQEQVVIDAYLQSIKYWYLEMIQIMLLHGQE